MALKTWGFVFLSGIVALAIVITILAFLTSYTNPLEFVVRLSALYGYLSLSVATMLTPFLREVSDVFGTPFIKMHHVFAALGTAFATVHPVAFAVRVMSVAVFLPSFESWYSFWALAGRPAFIIMYVALVGVVLRKSILRYWRVIHAFMYIVLFFGIVHANLIGTDFQNVIIIIVFNSLFAASMIAFALKRVQRYRMRRLSKS